MFTMNHVDGIDPELLRSGRMNVHVRLNVHTMWELVEQYIGVREHEMLDVAEMTPTEVGEVLSRNRDKLESGGDGAHR